MKPFGIPEPINSNHDLRTLRRELGISQAMLADLLGINPQAVSMLESGKSRLTRRTASHIALVFHHVALAQNATAPLPLAGAQGTMPALRPLGRPAKGIDPNSTYLFFLMDDTPVVYAPAVKDAKPGTLYKAEKTPEGDTQRGPRLVYVRGIGRQVQDAPYDPAVHGAIVNGMVAGAGPVPTPAAPAYDDPAIEAEWQATRRMMQAATEP